MIGKRHARPVYIRHAQAADSPVYGWIPNETAPPQALSGQIQAPPPGNTISWKYNISGLWSNATLWSSGSVPGASNAVILDTLSARTVTFASGTDTVQSLTAVTDLLDVTGGSLTIAGVAGFGSGLTDAGVLTLDGATATVTGGLNVDAGELALGATTTLTVTGVANFAGQSGDYGAELDGGVLQTSGTTNITAYANTYTAAVFGGGITWTNTGTVNLTGYVYAGDGYGNTAAYVNAAGASFNLASNYADLYDSGTGYSSTFANAGTLTLSGNTGTSEIDAYFTNTGLINAATTGTIQFDGGGSFGGTITGQGQVAFGAGANSTLTAGANFTVANWLINGGYVSMGTALAYAGNLTITSGSLMLDGTTDAVTGSFDETGSGSALYLNNSTLTLTGAYLGGYSALEGPGTLTTNGTTSLGSSSSYYIGGGAALINTGTINQNGQIYDDTNSGAGFTITNSAAGTYTINGNYAINGNNGYTPVFNNNGVFNEASGSYSYIYAQFNNTGTIDAASGTLYFQDGGSFGGTLTGAGTIAFDGGASTLTANAVYSTANLAVDSGSLTLDANAAPTSGAFSETGNAVIYLNGNTLSLNGATLGYGYVEGTGTLLTTGSVSVASQSTQWFGNGVEWINTGNVTQAQTVEDDSSNGGTFDLMNQTGGTYTLTGNGSFGYDNEGGGYVTTVENAGSFGKNTNNSYNYIYAYVTNTGTIFSSGGTLAFYDGGDFFGTLTGAGAIAFQGGTSIIDTGAVVSAAGIDVNGGALVLNENLTLSAGSFDESGGTVYLNGFNLTTAAATLSGYLVGTGTLAVSGTTSLANLYLGGGMVLSNTGTINQTSYVYNDTGNYGATIVNAAGAKYNFAVDGYLFNNGTSTADTFTNAGIFTKTGGTSVATINGTFNSTGTVTTSSSTGTIEFNGGGTFSGAINGTGTVEFYDNSVGLGNLSAASATYIDAVSASLYLTGNATIAGGFTIETYSSINLQGYTLSLSSSNTFGITGYGSYQVELYGAGTLSTTGNSAVAGYSSYNEMVVTDGADWANSGTVSDAGYLLLSDSSGAGTIVNSSHGAFDFTGDSTGINANTYTGTFVNAGTLAKTGGSLTTTINATVLDSGTLATTTGTLALADGGSLAGSIADKSSIVLTAGSFADTALTVGGGSTLTNDSTINATGTLTLGDTSTKAAAFTNAGTYAIVGAAAIVSGSTAANVFTNTGLLEQTAGTGRNVLSATIANTGTILAASGTLALTGTVTGTGILDIGTGATMEIGSAVATTQSITFLTNSGTLALDSPATAKDKIANFTVGTTIDLVNTTATSGTLSGGNTLTLYNGSTAIATLTLTGTHTGDTYAFTSDGRGGTLLNIASNVSTWANKTADWNTAADWNNGVPDAQTNVTVAGTTAYTLSLASNETAYANTIAFSDSKATYTLGGTFDLASTMTLSAGTLNLEGTLNGGTVTTTGGTLFLQNAYWQNVTYAGALSLNQAGESLEIGTALMQTGTGAGTISITGSNTYLYLDNIQTPSLTTINIGSNSGTANLISNDANGQGGVLVLTAAINQVGTNAAISDSGGGYDAILNEGTLTAALASGNFIVTGSDFENDGVMAVSNHDVLSLMSASVVNTGTITSSAGLTLANLQNAGTIVTTGGTLTLDGTLQSAGGITTASTLIDVNGDVTAAQLGPILGSGDTLEIGASGDYINTGATLTVGTGTALPQVTVLGTIEGGTIADNGGGIYNATNLTAPYPYGTLSDVTYDGALTLANDMGLTIAGTFTATGLNGTGPGTINDTGNNAEIIFTNTRTVDNAAITIGNNTATSYLSVDDTTGNGATLTLGQHLSLTQTGTYADLYFYQAKDTILNTGVLSASAAGTFQVGANGSANGTFTNAGSITISNGNDFQLNTGVVFTNVANSTLTGGSIEVDAGSTLQLANNTTIATLNGALTLSGAGSVVESLNTTTNKQITIDQKLTAIGTAGALTVKNGRAFTASAAFTDNGLLQLAGSTFTAASGLTVSGTGTVSGYGTIAAAIADAGSIQAANGTLTLSGAVTGTGTLGAAAGATLALTQGGTLSQALSGAGTLALGASATAYTIPAGATEAIAAIAVSAGATLTGSGSGTLGGALADAGLVTVATGTLSIDGAVSGGGTLAIAAGATLDLAGGGGFTGSITGAGTLRLDGADTFTLQPGGSLGAASVIVDSPATLDLTSGGALSGAITGTGTLQLDGTTPYTLTAGTTEAVATVLIDTGVALSGAGTLSGLVTDNGSLNATGGTLAIATLAGTGVLFAAAGGTLDLTEANTLSQQITGAGTLQLDNATDTLAGATLGIASVTVDAGATLAGFGSVTGSLTDNGTVDALGGTLKLAAIGGSGTLSAAANAVLDLTAAAALGGQITGAGTLQLDNATDTLAGGSISIAAITVDAGATLSGFGTVSGVLTDNGTVTAAGGTLILGALSGAGTLSATAGAILDLTAASALTQAITGGGTLQLDNATDTLAGATIGITAVTVDAGATLSGFGTVTGALTDTGTVLASGGTLKLGMVTGAGTLSAALGATLDLSAAATLTEQVTGPGTLQLDGGTYTLASTLGVASVLIDAGAALGGPGTIGGAVTDTGGLFTATGLLSVDGAFAGSGSLTIGSGATIDLLGGGTLSGAVSGAGTLQLDAAAYTLTAGEQLTNAVTLVDSTATLSGAGTFAGAVTDAGTIAATAGGTLVFLGPLTGTGSLTAAAGALLDLTAGGTLTEQISGAGTILLAGSTGYTLAGNTVGATTAIAAGATLSGTGTLSGAVIDAGVVAASGGTLTVANAISGTGSLQAASNAVLHLVSGGSLNNGVSGAGTLDLGGTWSLGTGALTMAELAIDAGSSLTGTGSLAAAIIDAGTIAAGSGALTLSGAVSGSGTVSAAAGATVTLSGTGTFSGALAGAGTIDLTNALSLGAGAVLSATSLVDSANVTLLGGVTQSAGSTLSIAAAKSTALALNGAAGTLTENGTLLASGAGTETVNTAIVNAGLITGSTGTLAFAGAVTNNGIIDAASGALTVAANVAGTGTLEIGATSVLTLTIGTSAGETVDFLAGTGTLDLATPLDMAGVISGFGAGDTIDLLKTPETSFTYSNGTLTVLDKKVTEAVLHFNGSYTQASFALNSDGHAGTTITFV